MRGRSSAGRAHADRSLGCVGETGALIAHGPEEQLDLTTNTQPVMLTAAIACWRVWIAETGVEPSALAGHSLGEYTALVAAGASP
jgi:[acyl-carrier-protein] S-malonyltransferase